MPLLATVDGVLLDLVADLVYDTAQGAVLVMYDFEGAADVDGGGTDDGGLTIAQRAGLLALAFQAATGRAACRIVAVQALAGAAALPFDDIPALSADARAALARRAPDLSLGQGASYG